MSMDLFASAAIEATDLAPDEVLVVVATADALTTPLRRASQLGAAYAKDNAAMGRSGALVVEDGIAYLLVQAGRDGIARWRLADDEEAGQTAKGEGVTAIDLSLPRVLDSIKTLPAGLPVRITVTLDDDGFPHLSIHYENGGSKTAALSYAKADDARDPIATWAAASFATLRTTAANGRGVVVDAPALGLAIDAAGDIAKTVEMTDARCPRAILVDVDELGLRVRATSPSVAVDASVPTASEVWENEPPTMFSPDLSRTIATGLQEPGTAIVQFVSEGRDAKALPLRVIADGFDVYAYPAYIRAFPDIAFISDLPSVGLFEISAEDLGKAISMVAPYAGGDGAFTLTTLPSGEVSLHAFSPEWRTSATHRVCGGYHGAAFVVPFGKAFRRVLNHVRRGNVEVELTSMGEERAGPARLVADVGARVFYAVSPFSYEDRAVPADMAATLEQHGINVVPAFE